MKITTTHNRKVLVGVLIFAAASMLMASWYVQEKQEDYRSAINLKMDEQETLMIKLAKLIDTNGADSIVSTIIQDCSLPERERFDTLLGKLSGLKGVELKEVDKLFDACGSFFSDRQAILSMRLQREVDVYDEYSVLLSLTGVDAGTNTSGERVDKWKSLNELELERSLLTTDLVNIQGDIINLLVEGFSTESEEISIKLEVAQNEKDSLSVLNSKSDTLREELSSI